VTRSKNIVHRYVVHRGSWGTLLNRSVKARPLDTPLPSFYNPPMPEPKPDLRRTRAAAPGLGLAAVLCLLLIAGGCTSMDDVLSSREGWAGKRVFLLGVSDGPGGINSLCRGYTLVVGRGNDKLWVYVHTSGPLPSAGVPVWVTGILRREEDFYPRSASSNAVPAGPAPVSQDSLADLPLLNDFVPQPVIEADTPEMKVLYAAFNVLFAPFRFCAELLHGPVPRSRRESVRGKLRDATHIVYRRCVKT
jgi:hypothetical protein